MSGDGRMQGKVGLIVGVANNRSLAWAIAQAVAAEGARVVLTYQGRFEEHVKELAEKLSRPATLVLPCDVQQDDEIASGVRDHPADYGGLDFLVHGAAFAPREDLVGGVLEDVARDGFRMALDISAYSLIALARGAPAADGSRAAAAASSRCRSSAATACSRTTTSWAWPRRRSNRRVRYLATDLGPQNIRVNAISAGPVKTLAAAGIGGLLVDSRRRAREGAAAPGNRDVGSGFGRGVPVERRGAAASPVK